MSKGVGLTIGLLGAALGIWAGFEIMSTEGSLRRIAPVAIGCFALFVASIFGRQAH